VAFSLLASRTSWLLHLASLQSWITFYQTSRGVQVAPDVRAARIKKPQRVIEAIKRLRQPVEDR
jgi:hypothetical protein